MNLINNTYSGMIQSYTKFTLNKLSDGTCLQNDIQGTQTTGQTGRIQQYDTLKLSQDQCQVTLDAPDKITSEIPRAWTIMGETAESFNNHLKWSLDEADRQNLSFGDRLTFLKRETQKWVADKRQNDTEMFVAWLKLNKDHIQNGEADLAGLPSDFTMEDYYSYVKEQEPFSTLV